MDTTTYDKIGDLIGGARHIGIVLGERADVDSTAAGLALYLSLTASGKTADVLGAKQPTVALGNLVGVNKIKQNSMNTSGLVISLPYQQGAIEKISYDIIGDRINLTVVPGPQGLTFTTDDITYESPQGGGRPDLLISVGVATEQEVSSIANDTQSPLINIDNSFDNQGFGTLALLDTNASSCSELVTKLLSTLNLPIDVDIAQNLLSGIVDATDNFQREDTAPFAFEAAGTLIAKGARRQGGGAAPKNDFATSQQAKGLAAWQKKWPQSQTPPNAPISQTLPKARPTGLPPRPVAGGQAGGSSQTPKDWFEPKIYKGSRATPIS